VTAVAAITFIPVRLGAQRAASAFLQAELA
jgi:hypothetical protein